MEIFDAILRKLEHLEHLLQANLVVQEKRFFTIKEAACYTGLTKTEINNAIKAKQIVYLKTINNKIAIEKEVLDNLLLKPK